MLLTSSQFYSISSQNKIKNRKKQKNEDKNDLMGGKKKEKNKDK